MELKLETDHQYPHMQALFAAELARKHERSTITLEDRNGKAVFRISARDTAALRQHETVTSIQECTRRHKRQCL